MSVGLTLDEVAGAVEALPAELREALAQGPLDEPDCRVCNVLIPDATKEVEAPVLGGDDGVTIVDFHEIGVIELAYAAHGALGTSRKLTTDEFESGTEAIPERDSPVRTAIVNLSGQLAGTRCLLIYMLAGWRP